MDFFEKTLQKEQNLQARQLATRERDATLIILHNGNAFPHCIEQ